MTTISTLGPVKLFGLLHRKKGTSLEAFRHHWRTVHKEEALKLTSFMQAYVQNHRRPEALPGLQAVADGAPEIWFRSYEDVIAMQTSEAYLTGAHLDEPNFMEGGAQGLVLSERVLKPGPAVSVQEDWVRVSVCLRKRTDVDGHRFAQWMAEDETDIMALNNPPERHTRALSLAARDAAPAFEAVETYWWPEMESFQKAWGKGVFAAEAPDYLDIIACAGLLTQEERVLWPEDGVDYGA